MKNTTLIYMVLVLGAFSAPIYCMEEFNGDSSYEEMLSLIIDRPFAEIVEEIGQQMESGVESQDPELHQIVDRLAFVLPNSDEYYEIESDLQDAIKNSGPLALVLDEHGNTVLHRLVERVTDDKKETDEA